MRFSHSLPLLALLPALLGAPVPTLRTDDLSLSNELSEVNGLGLIDNTNTEGITSNDAIPSLDSLDSLIKRESQDENSSADIIDTGLIKVNLSHKRRSKAHSYVRSTRSVHGNAMVASQVSQVNGTTDMVPAAAAAAGHAAALPMATPTGNTGSTSRSRKRMTNGERLAKGMKPLPPTRRSSAPNRRASQIPMMNTPTLVVRVIASTGTDLGLLSPPSDNQGEDGLLTFDPSARDPIRFQFPGGSGPAPFTSGPGGGGGGAQGGGPGAGGSFGPTGPNAPTSNIGNPFEISPRGPDDPLFGGLPRQLIGAIPHLLGNGELKPGSPNFANMGMGQCDQGSPLDLNLPPLPIVNTVGGLLSGLPQLLGKLPGSLGGLLGLNLGGGQSGQSQSGQESGNGRGPLGGLGGLLHIVGPNSGSGSGPASGLVGGLPLVGGKGGNGNDNGENHGNHGDGGLLGLHLPSHLLARPGQPGAASSPSQSNGDSERPTNTNNNNDSGLLGLHLPSNLLGRPGTSSSSSPSSSGNSDASSPSSNGHSHSEPTNGHFPLDTAPVPQQAQTAIWHCDERGNMGASWQNPDGSRIPAQFFTGGPCAHTICLAADVEALKSVHGGDLAEVKLVAGIL